MSEVPEELFDRYLDGYLAPDELAELEVWINKDPEHARQFLEWSATHLDTRAAMAANELREQAVPSDPGEIEPRTDESPAPAGRRIGFLFQHLATAACVALLMTSGYFLMRMWQQDSAPSRPIAAAVQTPASKIQDPAAARIVQRIDSVMQEERWNVTNLNRFDPGQSVRIAEGVVVVEFDCGAQVTLQGPADMEVVSTDRGFLRSGSLTAYVPPSAVGFEILTPAGRVIDHGTAFGIRVAENGDSETHVFDGEVEIITAASEHSNEQGGNKSGPNEGQRLTENMAVHVPGDSVGEAESIPASPGAFIRLPAHETQLASHTKAITELPKQDKLVMWFEASQGVQLDDDSRVISWQNLAATQNASSDTESVPSSAAWQVDAETRPLWKDGDVADRSAVVFGGWQGGGSLATTPIQTGDDATAIVVCKYGQTRRGGYGQLLTLGHRVRLVLERRIDNRFGSVSWSNGTESVPGYSSELLDPSRAIPIDTAHVCAVRYSHQSETYEIFVNGQLQSQGKPIGSLSEDVSYVIGCSNDRSSKYFCGSIAEIVVYDQMLDRKTLDQATAALMKKYAIAPASP